MPPQPLLLSLAPFLTLGKSGSSPSVPPAALPPPPRLILSRQPHRFTFCVPPAVSLDLASSVSLPLSLSIYLSPADARVAYQSVSVPRSVSAFSHRFSRSPSRVLLRARLSRSVFRRGTASRSSRYARDRPGHRGERGEGGRGLKQVESGEEVEASSRSIAKHWAELVYRRIEGERASGGRRRGTGGGRGDAALVT